MIFWMIPIFINFIKLNPIPKLTYDFLGIYQHDYVKLFVEFWILSFIIKLDLV